MRSFEPEPKRISASQVLLSPAVGLMNRLTYREKFLLISVLFAAPLALAMHLLFSELQARSEAARTQALGTRYLRPLMSAFRHAGEARLAARALADGEAGAHEDLTEHLHAVETDLGALATIDAEIGHTLRSSESFAEVRRSWVVLSDELEGPDADQVDARYAAFLAEAQALAGLVGDHLILDPGLETYDLADLLLSKLPEGQLLLLEAAQRASTIAARQPRTVAERDELVALSSRLQANVNATRRRAEIALHKNPAGRVTGELAQPYDALVSGTNDYLTAFNRDVVYAHSITTTPAAVVAAARRALAASFTAWESTAATLDALVAERIDALERREEIAFGATLVILVFVAYLWFGFYRAVVRTVGRLELASLRMLRGEDPAEGIALETRDELALVVESFNAISKRLRREWEQAEEEKRRALAAEARLKQSERGLQSALEAAESASEAKSRFLATMSHELRTPLNSVIGFANVLLKRKGKDLRDQDVTYLERIVANGEHLLGLINSILDLSKVEADKMEVHLTTVDLGAFVRETVAQLEGRVVGHAVRLVADAPAHLDPIEVDADKLRQVLINLVGNALKFTERGSVTVRVVGTDDGRTPVSIEVRDTGPGIPEEMREAIFDAFRQVDTSTARAHEGTGLGLAIARSLCKLMGHRIELESTVGEGSTFRIVLRPTVASLHPPGTSAPAKNTSQATPSEGSGEPAQRIEIHVRRALAPLVPGFLENRRSEVERLRKALSVGDFEAIRAAGHDMKGTGAGYGFERITEIGRALEDAASALSEPDIAQQLAALSDYLTRVDVVPGT